MQGVTGAQIVAKIAGALRNYKSGSSVRTPTASQAEGWVLSRSTLRESSGGGATWTLARVHDVRRAPRGCPACAKGAVQWPASFRTGLPPLWAITEMCELIRAAK